MLVSSTRYSGIVIFNSSSSISPVFSSSSLDNSCLAIRKEEGTTTIGNDRLQIGFNAPEGYIKTKNSSGSPASNLAFYTTDTSGNTNKALHLSYNGRILTNGETAVNEVSEGGIHIKTVNDGGNTHALILENHGSSTGTQVIMKFAPTTSTTNDRWNSINVVNVDGSNKFDTAFYTCPGGTPLEAMRIDNQQRLLIGYYQNIARHEAQNAALQISGTARDDSSAAIGRWSTDANPARLEFSKSRNATIGNHTAVAADDEIGHINFSGSDGTRYLGAAFIKGIATTPIADYDCAGYLSFGTNYGTTSPSERVRITEDGYVHLGNTAHGTNKVGGQAITGQDYDPVVKVYSSGSNNWLAQLRSDHTSGNGIFLRAGNSSSTYTLYATGYDENNPHLVVRGDGKVGIGEDDPDGNQLLIRGASTFQTNKGHIMLTGDSATVGQGPQIVFSESGSTTSYAGAYIGHVRQGSNSVGDLAFGTRGVTGDANTVPTERLRIKDTGSVIIYRSPSTTSGGYATLEHMESNALRTHTRYISAGGSSATINLMRIRRHYWGAGFYKIWLKQVYYSATNEAVWWVNGHGRNLGGYTPTWNLGHEDKNGSISSSVISHTTSSNSSPGNDYAQYIDIYATVSAYHHYIVHIEAMGSVVFSHDTSSVSDNGYALF